MTALDDPGSCPDPEMLAAFLEGSLTGEDWQKIADHVQWCDRCLFAIREAGAYEWEEEETAAPATFWPVAAAILIAVISGALFFVLHRADPLKKISTAIGQAGMRPFEGRVAAVDYARYVAPRSGAQPPQALTAVAKSLLRRRPQSPKEWHTQGLISLVLGNSTDAVAALSEAVRLEPESAAWRNDLAAARIASATEKSDPGELQRALADSEASLRLQRTPEALFNRALAFERMGDSENARRAYGDYLALDPHSSWADEVRWRLARLQR